MVDALQQAARHVVDVDPAPHIFSPAYYQRLHEVEDRHWWSRGMRDVAAALLAGSLANRTPHRVLDAGCGTGGTIDWLRRFGWKATTVGIDLSAEALSFSRSRGHAHLCESSVGSLPFKDSTFDLVVCNDVLQHLARPGGDEAALREFARVLCPNGLLLIRSNAQRESDRQSGESDYVRYRLDELGEKVSQAGFTIHRLTYGNCVSVWIDRLPLRRSQTTKRRNGGSNPGLAIRLLPPWLCWLNILLYQCLRLEAAYLRATGGSIQVGHSTFCVASKTERLKTLHGMESATDTSDDQHRADRLVELGCSCGASRRGSVASWRRRATDLSRKP